MSTSKASKLASFNPNEPGSGLGTIFGLPFTEQEADLVIVPVPWEVTCSYGSGTSQAPAAIYKASLQVDLYDFDNPKGWQRGIYLRPEEYQFSKTAHGLRTLVEAKQANQSDINQACKEMVNWVKLQTGALLDSNKKVGLLGGDHSTPLGFLQALSERHKDFGVLQIDAHCDLREAYEGFEYSHASIMFNALQLPSISKLVQVGIRDYCEEESERIAKSSGRIRTFFDSDLKRGQYQGQSWKKQCTDIVAELPAKVYVSFDIDGLDPKLCPHTGTPVPGGLEFEQAVYLIKEIVTSGRAIIGFDLNEVSPREDEWDANVGARMLYKLCAITFLSDSMLSI